MPVLYPDTDYIFSCSVGKTKIKIIVSIDTSFFKTNQYNNIVGTAAVVETTTVEPTTTTAASPCGGEY